jgi:hypothetical protein
MLKRLSQKWSTTYPTDGASMVFAKAFLLTALAIAIWFVITHGSPNDGTWGTGP